MDYLSWNDAIATNFFRADMAGRKVFLYVTAELLDRLGDGRSDDHTGFIRAVIGGPSWATQDGLCRKALTAYREWRTREVQFPPYIGYLGLFTLAAGLEGDFAPHAYYPRLRTLLGERPITGQYRHFNYMHVLWEDLERWSQEDKGGRLGIFNVIFASKMLHVGIPMAQTLLTEAEASCLPDVFGRGALDPTSLPSGEDLAASVRMAGAGDLRHRTLQLLASRSGEHQDLREALIQILTDELGSWDGTVPPVRAAEPAPLTSTDQEREAEPLQPAARETTEPESVSGGRSQWQGRVFGALRLLCAFERVSNRMQISVVCRTAHVLPDDGLVLQRLGTGDRYICDDMAAGWSSVLQHETAGIPLDGSTLDWSLGAELTDPAGVWRFRLPGGPIRIFVNAQSVGMPGLIEVSRLPLGAPFYLAARRDCAERIGRWGVDSCNGFREFVGVSGMPAGWRFFYADRANGDEQVRDAFPILALPRSVNLQFEGGVRAEVWNQYFDFAPPHVVLSAADEGTQVVCNGAALAATDTPGRYELPLDAPRGTRLVVEAVDGGETLVRKNLWLLGDVPWPVVDGGGRFDPFAKPVAEGVVGGVYAGAVVEGLVVPQFVAPPFLDFARNLRVIFVGSMPGQVAVCPSEPVPVSWSAVWRIEFRGKKGQAFYCGADGEESPASDLSTGDRRRVAQWREVLWNRRKRVRLPPDHHALWRQYLLRARDG